MPQITGKSALIKPRKPYPEFPLFPHATKRWAKKIRGKLHYFGKWDDPDAALLRYQEQRDDLHAGRTPRPHRDSLTVRGLLNRFLTAKQNLRDAGEITPRTFADYFSTSERIGTEFGLDRLVDDLASDDFDRLRAAIARKWGPTALDNEIQRVRVVFKFAYDANLIDKPIRYGQSFKRPSRKVLRQVKNAKGERMFEAEQIRKMMRAAPPQLEAMILLAINCGYGNHDVATLPIAAIHLERGWASFPRPKTAIKRRCPLWPETIAAVRKAIADRPSPKNSDDDGLVFITRNGHRWAKDKPESPVSRECAKLLKQIGINRKGLNFYAFRHTFETVGGETKDQVAVDSIMGHAPAANDMASIYRERISDERLQTVTDYVRKWLFGVRRSKVKGERSARGRTVGKPAASNARRARMQ